MENQISNRFRVWCKNKKQWERNNVALLPNGQLIDLDHRNMPLRPDTHIVEWCIDVMDKSKKLIYESDIVLFQDGNIFGKATIIREDGCMQIKTEKSLPHYPITMPVSNIDEFEIIGNIHDTSVDSVSTT